MDQENVSLREKVKKIGSQMEEVKSERDYMEKKMKETKKKNQLLKLAILRLQNEVEEFKKQEKKEVKE